ncbi:alpha/beta fold hydrolase [Heyndrickxia sp. MSNUG]|uniref:alpha/beta fold hydrolase n=1 Tax=Heyndrickxia sp. MSNUG TaxID=3136677 RepID=UPI003C30C42C
MEKWVQQIINTKRGNFEIFVKGSGEPICVTHHYSEFNSSGDYFADVFTEQNQVILVNLREAGQSAKAEEPYQLSMIEAILDLEGIREALSIPSWSFAGHSTGGMLGVLYVIHFSQLLDSLIIVGSAAREYSSSEGCIYNKLHADFELMQSLIEKLKHTGLTETERKAITRQRTMLSLFRSELHDEYFNKKISKKLSSKRLNFFSREALIFDVTRQLHKITVKTLILCGRHDVQCPVLFSEEMKQLIPSSKLHVFENSSHYPFLEEESQFKSAVRNFFQ